MPAHVRRSSGRAKISYAVVSKASWRISSPHLRPDRVRRPPLNVLWAFLRDGRCYEPAPPTALAA